MELNGCLDNRKSEAAEGWSVDVMKNKGGESKNIAFSKAAACLEVITNVGRAQIVQEERK